MTLLTSKLKLHDVDDVERFCASHLQTQPQWRQLEEHRKDDALAYLISETWRISTRYDPARNTSFSKHAYAYQPKFFIQWLRDTFVDQRYGDDDKQTRDAIAHPASLDAPVVTADGEPGRLGDLVAVSDRDDQADSEQVLRRFERERDRYRAWDLTVLRQGLSEASTTRAARAEAA